MYQIRISLYLETITLESRHFARLLKALTNSALLTEVNQQAQPTYDVTCIRRIRAQAPWGSPKNACVGDYIGRRRKLAARASAPSPPPPPTPLGLTLPADNVTKY